MLSMNFIYTEHKFYTKTESQCSLCGHIQEDVHKEHTPDDFPLTVSCKKCKHLYNIEL